MNKSEFLSVLEKSLISLEKEERNKYMTYYDEMIEDYEENGFKEEEAVNKIGSPKRIADDILREQDTVMINMPYTGNKIVNAILIILGFPLWGSLLLAAVLFILSIYVVIWCIPFTTGVSAMAFFVTSIISILGSPFVMAEALATGVVQLGLGIASIGISILSTILTVYFSKKLLLVTKIFTSKLYGAFQKKVVRV